MQATRAFERYLAVMAAAGCVVITVAVWLSVSRVQPMWPLPALYLIEVTASSIVAVAAFLRGGRDGRVVTWGAIGILAAFSILGMFSVGALYLPTTLVLAGVAVVSDVRNKAVLALHVGIMLLAGVVQAGVMLAVIRMI